MESNTHEADGLDLSLHETGVHFHDLVGNTPKMKAKKHTPKLKIYREFVLATLSYLIKSSGQETSSQIPVLDGLASTGVAGIQWKKHFHSDLHVTLADHDDLSPLIANVKMNSLTVVPTVLDTSRVSGDAVSIQGESEISVCRAEAKAVMTMEAFKFIYLHPHKSCMNYFEAACHSIGNGGILCLVISDVSMFARSPNVAKRYYDADVIKTEYLKEMSARIVLANLVNCSARCNKVIHPLYIVSQEDQLLVCVKVTRGHTAADKCVSEVRQLIHCRLCEERSFLPAQLAPLEEPYSYLPCRCKSTHPGKTAVLLGPMWQGHLFDQVFLSQLSQEGKLLGLSSQFEVLSLLLMTECTAQSIPSSTRLRSKLEQTSSQSNKNRSDHGMNSMIDCEANANNSTDQTSQPTTELANNTDQTSQPTTELANNTDQTSQPTTELANNTDQTSQPTTELANNTDQTSQPTTELANNSSTTSGTAQEKISGSVDAKSQTEKHLADPVIEVQMTPSLKRKHGCCSEDCQCQDNDTRKRQNVSEVTDAIGISLPLNVPFYQNAGKFKKRTLPKLNCLVTTLQSSGYHACRTHFDPQAIRTSANVQQFLNCFSGLK